MKKSLSERDICTKFITPAIQKAGWDVGSQIREEVSFTKGRIIVRGRLVTRGKAKRADYILYYKPNIPLALIEAKDNNCAVGDGMQQALEYAATLDIPFVFSSNGDAFLFHDRTGQSVQTENELPLDAFPAPDNLWGKYRAWKGMAREQEEIFLQDYFEDTGGKEPRYYQRIAINKAIEAIGKGQNRILLVMATGTNLLFFEKGTTTKEVWFYEHRVPEGQKAYSMTKPIRFDHLKPCIEWWEKREENEVAWKVSIEDIKSRNYNLDFKNPHTVEEDHGDPTELLAKLEKSEAETAKLRERLKAILEEALLR